MSKLIAKSSKLRANRVYKIRLLKGDTVVVRLGKYKGQTGKVLATHPSLNKVTVEGVNIAKRHLKPSRSHPQGGIIEITKPIWVSKVSVLEPTTSKPSRIGYVFTGDGQKDRIYKRTGKKIKEIKT